MGSLFELYDDLITLLKERKQSLNELQEDMHRDWEKFKRENKVIAFIDSIFFFLVKKMMMKMI